MTQIGLVWKKTAALKNFGIKKFKNLVDKINKRAHNTYCALGINDIFTLGNKGGYKNGNISRNPS